MYFQVHFTKAVSKKRGKMSAMYKCPVLGTTGCGCSDSVFSLSFLESFLSIQC